MNTFKERAHLLGISADTDFRGVVKIESLERLIEILADAPDAELADRLFDGVSMPEGEDTTLHLSRRIAEHIYGGPELSPGERALADTAFPLDVNVMSLPDKTINTEWNLNDETPSGMVIVSLGTLTINDGGYVVISNRMLDMTLDHLVRNGTTLPAGRAEFNVLGIDGAEGAKGDNPDAPGQARNGSPGNCSSAGIAGKSGGDGTAGDPGAQGGTGDPGKDGLPSLAAVIRVNQSVTATGPIQILTRSGSGGKGGQGGTGSKGGQGGNGGNGATCGCTGSSGGSGAQGGPGGKGGTGGPGGNGVDAAGNVNVKVPAADVSKFAMPQKLPAPYGAGGEPGDRGAGGAGGGAGSGGKHNDGGSGGKEGGAGDPGTRGAPGTHTGSPAEVTVLPLA